MDNQPVTRSHERDTEISVSRDSIPSGAAIAGHPIHPMLIPFPVAFLTFALVTDIVYWSVGDFFWARASLWLIGAGVVSGALAGSVGMIDFAGNRAVRQYRAAWVHAFGNITAMVIALANLLSRIDEPAQAVVPVGFLLSAVTAGLLVVTGWYGGELSYRHRVGVMPQSEQRTSVP